MHKVYVTELHRSLGYLATWLPTFELQLGDVLSDSNDGLRRVGHVRDHGLSVTPHGGRSRAGYEYTSSGAVSISAKLAGQVMADSALGETEAGLVIKFSRTNATVFVASGCASMGIADLIPLGRAIEKRYAAGNWDHSWMVVTELVKANAVTIIIAGSQSAQADLKASGEVGQVGIKLSDINVRLEAKRTIDIGFKIIASTGLTPLYRASGMKRSWLGAPRFRRGSAEHKPGGSVAFTELSPDDFPT